MIITIAFASGFQETISQKVFSFWGHIQVQNYETARVTIAEETPILKNDSVTNLATLYPSIQNVQAFATKNAILKTSETIEGILFKGVESDYNFKNLDNFLVSGRWIRFVDSGYSNEVNLSASTASQLKLKVNDYVLIYFIQPNGAAPRPRGRPRRVSCYSFALRCWARFVRMTSMAIAGWILSMRWFWHVRSNQVEGGT